MQLRLAPHAVVLGLALLAGGCGGRIADAPSLAPRPIETRADADAPAAAAAPVAADPALAAAVAALLDRAQAAHRAFGEERARAEAVVARPAARTQGSDAWLAGQTALSALQGARGGLQDVAQDLDTLRREHTTAAPADLATLEAAGDRLDALGMEEDAAVAQAAARLD